MTQCSESRKEAARLTPLLTPRTLTRLATWNIRTMYETGKTVQVAREMKRYKIRVLGLCETDTVRTAQTLIRRAAAVLRTHRGGSPPPPPPPPPILREWP